MLLVVEDDSEHGKELAVEFQVPGLPYLYHHHLVVFDGPKGRDRLFVGGLQSVQLLDHQALHSSGTLKVSNRSGLCTTIAADNIGPVRLV